MGFVHRGVTHCKQCMKPLKMNEYSICNECENKNKYKTIGRRQGKTIELSINLRNSIKELPEGKMFGVINLKDGIIINPDEVINKKAIKELINSESINISGFKVIAVEDLEELLEEK